MAVLSQVVNQQPEPLTKIRPDVDPMLASICTRAMAKKPEDRYPSMSALAADLDAYLRNGAAQTIKQPPRWRSLRIAVGAGGIAALVFLGVIIFIRNRDGSTTKIEVPADATIEVRLDGERPGDQGAGQDFHVATVMGAASTRDLCPAIRWPQESRAHPQVEFQVLRRPSPHGRSEIKEATSAKAWSPTWRRGKRRPLSSPTSRESKLVGLPFR